MDSLSPEDIRRARHLTTLARVLYDAVEDERDPDWLARYEHVINEASGLFNAADNMLHPQLSMELREFAVSIGPDGPHSDALTIIEELEHDFGTNQATYVPPSTDAVYEMLNSQLSEREKIWRLHDYLRRQITRRYNEPEESEAIAYQIAGLLSTEFIRHLPDDHPCTSILSLAGRLELPKPRHEGASWREMYELVNKLPLMLRESLSAEELLHLRSLIVMGGNLQEAIMCEDDPTRLKHYDTIALSLKPMLDKVQTVNDHKLGSKLHELANLKASNKDTHRLL